MEPCRSNDCRVISQEEHFGKGLKIVFAKGMDVVHKRASKDCREVWERQVETLACTEDEEGIQALPTSGATWFPVARCQPSCTTPGEQAVPESGGHTLGVSGVVHGKSWKAKTTSSHLPAGKEKLPFGVAGAEALPSRRSQRFPLCPPPESRSPLHPLSSSSPLRLGVEALLLSFALCGRRFGAVPALAE